MSDLLTILAEGGRFGWAQLSRLSGKRVAQLRQEMDGLRQQGLCFDDNESGLELIMPLAPLDGALLRRALSPYSVEIKRVIDSTNQYIMDNAEHLHKGALCLAEYQTAGRGRRGRRWLSPFAGQAIFSFYWHFNEARKASGLTLIIGMAIAEVLREMGAQGVALKWPNDLLLDGRKLGGILAEVMHLRNGCLNLVVGVGINLSLFATDEIDQPWAELCEVLPNLDRNQLIIRIIQRIYHYLESFEQTGINTELQEKWKKLNAFYRREVRVITEQKVIWGVDRGIDEEGHLLLQNRNNELLRFNGGEVSLRGN
ncbi:BirA family biotin operon repressor/biotin-[acetyl-CoA-carboxylase] ligase [Mesocricetibacter intestinalis]|uniref:biotin--[biotin carboxyl-carrier protein] ligase n=1 Tax=Mesocricetibacter intestinalis TaxID=1521930 RepID=A0A4R6VA30_9PAST|nr:bifunctional biotin--[acetyl-CoA-carboxylase] ligase/biotin operon repressor BirA [Mesocricetibacter intestinalis]TDQ56533.1 BirA family biotin operon repressor/biotin-[acetyl-CoA-carboxylase] ligase [Mesocricetibacter intestinalis]